MSTLIDLLLKEFQEGQRREQIQNEQQEAWNTLPSTTAHRFKNMASFNEANKRKQQFLKENGFPLSNPSTPNSQNLEPFFRLPEEKQDLSEMLNHELIQQEEPFFRFPEERKDIKNLLDALETGSQSSSTSTLNSTGSIPRPLREHALQQFMTEKRLRGGYEDGESVSLESSDRRFLDSANKKAFNEELDFMKKLYEQDLYDNHENNVLSDLFSLSQEAPKGSRRLADVLQEGMNKQGLKKIEFFPGGDWLASEDPVGVQTAYHLDPLYTLGVHPDQTLEWKQNPNWVTLTHEVGHTASDLNDPKSMRERLEQEDKQDYVWSNSEERRNIRDIETSILEESGRLPRFGHAGLNPFDFYKPKRLANRLAYQTQLATGQPILTNDQFRGAYNQRYMVEGTPNPAERSQLRRQYQNDKAILEGIASRSQRFQDSYGVSTNPDNSFLKDLYAKNNIYIGRSGPF